MGIHAGILMLYFFGHVFEIAIILMVVRIGDIKMSALDPPP
jgi:hypothetical protein